MIFCHQSLQSEDGVENAPDIRATIEKVNADAGRTKVGVGFSGHHHLDDLVEIAGVKYIQVNSMGVGLSGHHHIDFQRTMNGITHVQIDSMSYSWIGGRYAHVRYGADIDKTHPYIKYTAPYRDALFALVTLDPAGVFRLEGTTSEFVGPSPRDLGVPDNKGTDRRRERLVPKISDRKIPLGVRSA